MAKRDFPPIHPGEILLEEFLKPLEITQYRLAKDITVPQRRIGEQISELMERDDTMTRSASGRTSHPLGVVLRAARNAIGTAMTIANKVPSVAIASVSHSGRHNSCR